MARAFEALLKVATMDEFIAVLVRDNFETINGIALRMNQFAIKVIENQVDHDLLRSMSASLERMIKSLEFQYKMRWLLHVRRVSIEDWTSDQNTETLPAQLLIANLYTGLSQKFIDLDMSVCGKLTAVMSSDARPLRQFTLLGDRA